ncbi:thioredoxin family protein [Streptomyces lavendulae]
MTRRVHRPLENAEFDFIVGMAEGPVLVCFTGTWPKAVEACRAMEDLLAELAREYGSRLTAVRADITRCPGPVLRYGVTGAPTVVLLRSGEAVATHAGPLTEDEFRTFLDTHL